MSKHSFNFLVSLASVLFQMAVLSAPANPVAKLNPEPGYDQTTERGPHHRIWRTTRVVPNADGQLINKPSQYTEIQSGMHYFENGEWKESKEIIDIVGDGGAALQGPFKVKFNANINTPGAIDLTVPDGKRFRSHVIGLSYFDAATGKSVCASILVVDSFVCRAGDVNRAFLVGDFISDFDLTGMSAFDMQDCWDSATFRSIADLVVFNRSIDNFSEQFDSPCAVIRIEQERQRGPLAGDVGERLQWKTI